MEIYEQLEKEFGEWQGCGRPHTVAVASGTAALHLALEALELPIGSECLCPSYTMIACPRAIVMAGLKPVFVDCGDDLLIDVEKMKRALTVKTRAILCVHIYGRRCAMQEIADFAVYNGLKIVEDLAEAHGIAPHPDTDAACWSFYRNKIIHGEEGGMIAFKRPEHAEIAKELRSIGFTKAHDFLHRPRGVNARMSNLHAAPILESLRNYREHAAWRREVYFQHLVALETLDKKSELVNWLVKPPDVCPWVFDIRLLKHDPELIVPKLNEMGIQARLGFKPCEMQPEFLDPDGFLHLNSYRLSRQVMYLPINPEMTESDVMRNCESLVSLLV